MLRNSQMLHLPEELEDEFNQQLELIKATFSKGVHFANRWLHHVILLKLRPSSRKSDQEWLLGGARGAQSHY